VKNKINLVPNDSFSTTITTNIFTSISSSTPTDVLVVREPLLGLYPNKSENDDFMSLSFGESMPMGSGFVLQYRKPSPSQDIIPNDLLEHYLSMTNPIHYQTIDPDLSHHCAYSLPAVALTLGRQNWPCLRETYELLAAEMQWKVRWTLASSLHQMSLILGSDLTTRDLLPIFLSFMKDLDEVRFGILQNLASFLKLLLRPQQQGILPKISEFLKMDNNRNWRFRYTLAKQIIELANLYNASEIREYLLPIGLVLLVDKVSEVRLAAISLISVLIKQIFESENNSTQCGDNKLDIIEELNTHFANSSKWIHRQTYILLCEQLVQNASLSIPLFIDGMLEHLLNMSTDNVPNIRLVLARTIVNTLWPIGN
jgi:serine/threonine-protein phosphatase 4 regulatory subunit 1